MTTEQWLLQYKIINKQKEEESKLRVETIKAVVEHSMDFMKNLSDRNSEMVGYFIDKKEYFEYMERKKALKEKREGKETLSEDESLNKDMDLFMSDAFPDNLILESTLKNPDAVNIKDKKKRFVGIQKR